MIILAELKSYLWITDSSQDAILQIFVDSANKYITNYIWRNITAQDYTEYVDWDWQRIILLDNYPVNSITSFKVNEWTIETPDWVDVDPNEYKLVPEEWKIFLTFYKRRGFQNYEIVYNAGYSTIPWDLKLAWLKIASTYYNTKDTDWIERESVAGDSITFWTKETDNILNILNLYKDV